MKTTPTYGISYIEGGDLVSNAAAGFRKAAETTEAALKLVDQRSTIAGVKPAIAGTLATLATMRGSTGQTGYVTSDGNNNGPYCWNGSAWVKYAQDTQINSLQSQIAAITQGYEFGMTATSTDQNGVANVDWVRHSTSPQVMLVMLARTSSDELNRLLSPMVYELTNNGAQVRFRRNDSNAWAANQPTQFYWLALWK